MILIHRDARCDCRLSCLAGLQGNLHLHSREQQGIFFLTACIAIWLETKHVIAGMVSSAPELLAARLMQVNKMCKCMLFV